MHRVVSSVIAVAALITGGLTGAASAAADTVPQRPSPAEAPSSGTYTALNPARILDTRPTSFLAPGTARTLTVAGRGGVPSSGAAAVVINLTAVTPSASGYLSAYPNVGKPTSSNLNFSAGRTIANLAIVPVNANGTVQLYNGSGGNLNVLADVTGWFTSAGAVPTLDGAFKPVGPTRLLDTRPSNPVPAGGSITLQVTGKASIPAVAGAAFLNITAVGAGASGYLTAYPGTTRPTASTLNFATGQTVAGSAAVRLDTDGSVTLYNSSSKPLQLTVDVAGWFRGSTGETAGTFGFLSPARLFDTRGDGKGIAGGTDRQFYASAGGVPISGVSAVVLTVTATNATASGYLTVYGGTTTTASTLNFNAGQTVPNLVIVPLSGHDITIHNGSGQKVDVLADVSGYVRDSDLSIPSTSVSRYVNDFLSTASDTTITNTMHDHGCDDATTVTDSDPRTTVLEFGAQSNKAGNGSQLGVLPPNTVGGSQRLTYAQVVTAVKGYLDGFSSCRGEDATGVVTVAVGTNSDGFAGATYTPTAKGTDWAAQVVGALTSYGADHDVTIVGASDIEANFDASAAEVKTWVSSYLAGNSLQLINNGAAVQCPATLGQYGQSCKPVAIDHGGQQTWTQADYVQFSHTIAPTRISVLPQIYSPDDANRWENIALQTGLGGTGPLLFAGVLTQYAVCGASCSPTAPSGWALMRQALDYSPQTDGLALPTVSDIDYDS